MPKHLYQSLLSHLTIAEDEQPRLKEHFSLVLKKNLEKRGVPEVCLVKHCVFFYPEHKLRLIRYYQRLHVRLNKKKNQRSIEKVLIGCLDQVLPLFEVICMVQVMMILLFRQKY